MLSFLRACRKESHAAVHEWKPDLVHVHWWFPNGMALLALRPLPVPTVLTSHGTDLFLLDRKTSARGFARRVFRAAQKVTVISSPLVDRVVSLGVSLHNITVIPMPVDRSLLAQTDVALRESRSEAGRTVHLLFVGRLTERKGTEFAIRALKLLLERGVKAELTVVGDGPLRFELDALCDELKLGTAVHFLGMLPPRDVIARMRDADVFLMPAITDAKGEQEGFGMVIVEAMFSGLPVVASASGGITDIIRDGENGLLVEERNVEALAAAVVRLARNTELARKLTEAARQSVLQQFHPDAIAAHFEAVYESAVLATR
jgi:glycosyltransferase involved in cell wall biosynthesis